MQSGSSKTAAVINVTPLIDVLLVLLIIFLLITPENFHGLDTRIPAPASETSGGDTSVVVRIAADHGLTINTQSVAWNELANRFLEIYARRANKVLFVDAARSVEFNDVAQVIDTAKGAGVTFVAFMPKQQGSRANWNR